jgi:hypothetical protein
VDDPLYERDAHINHEVLEEYGETATVPPHPRDAPAVARSELDEVPEDGRENRHSDRVGNHETHLHLLAKLNTSKIVKKHGNLQHLLKVDHGVRIVESCIRDLEEP